MLRARTFASRKMQDTLLIGTVSGGGFGNDPGEETWSYNDASGETPVPIKCRVKTARSKETEDGALVTITNIEIHVPVGTDITKGQRVKVTKRFRETLGTAEVYTVEGAPENRRYALVLNCNRVTGDVPG